ncbi:MAG TPA: hypothetical protein VHO70_04935 [Chitinispirillaceae bacterium]|nr:hypothetical protein [Chitinispirillaceae bacterium]
MRNTSTRSSIIPVYNPQTNSLLPRKCNPFIRIPTFNNLLFSITLIAVLQLPGCYQYCNIVSENPSLTLQELYQAAILDAVVADSNEICTTLVAITPANSNLSWRGSGDSSRVLVTTWTKYVSSYPVGDTIILTWGETWVTVPYEFKKWNAEFHPNPDSSLRIEQLLGMPPNKGYTHFIELWIRPGDLFRPSPDCEITDSRAGLSFPSTADSTFKTWFNGNIIYSYFPPHFPWTRLGYTYDWGNSQSEIGLSEFVIRRNCSVIVNAVYTTAEYINQ